MAENLNRIYHRTTEQDFLKKKFRTYVLTTTRPPPNSVVRKKKAELVSTKICGLFIHNFATLNNAWVSIAGGIPMWKSLEAVDKLYQ